MAILRIDASIQGPNSASSALADLVEKELAGAPIVRRHLATDPIPADAWANAIQGTYAPAEHRTDAHRSALALAGELAAELRSADAAILALPFYNYGVSQHVKAWFDLAMAGGEQGEKFLDGKPAVVLTTRGGAYGPGTPRDGWDHNTDYLRRVVGDIWGAELILIEREFTLVGVNPALDAFTETAELMHKTAAEAASAAGRVLASR
ncbi:FMN-dependent NADH-azoreductase [Actinoplanes campanulatus]|uniref:FMN-dependent NADH-azoreductase n=1 Tax=Actinoplanes campanulatus TaxID=113559 RepID=A0A7W5FDA6_9ACTN|nr:NAD(P)H-dependent oxidoreductase [Actinoplanes campanulatus]MBB3094254.1 FMN-dependent NADH-azoreductase [Actinoplanes campanulatus]GGN42902.1 FMN-dependent NADH-azoreductase [Actinoplanes campanulatus]GID35826.1 FMN-dependent NADH-azoreductase [Actinoplanes campanulatus]